MIPLYKLREFVDKATNVVMNYTDTEAKVRALTNDDPWGSSSSAMDEVAKLTYHYEMYLEVMGMLWKRMFHENNSVNWLRTLKSLILLDYLIRHGSDQVVASAREQSYDIAILQNYSHIDHEGKDRGASIRAKAKIIVDLLNDEGQIKVERQKAKSNRSKYTDSTSQYRPQSSNNDYTTPSTTSRSSGSPNQSVTPSMECNRTAQTDKARSRASPKKVTRAIKQIDLGSAAAAFVASAKQSQSDQLVSDSRDDVQCAHAQNGSVSDWPSSDGDLLGIATELDGLQLSNAPDSEQNVVNDTSDTFADFQTAFDEVNNNSIGHPTSTDLLSTDMSPCYFNEIQSQQVLPSQSESTVVSATATAVDDKAIFAKFLAPHGETGLNIDLDKFSLDLATSQSKSHGMPMNQIPSNKCNADKSVQGADFDLLT